MSLFNPKKQVNTSVPSNQEAETLKDLRQIVIGTDGNSIALIKAEVSGSLELAAVLKYVIAGIEKGIIKIKPVINTVEAGV